MSVSPGSTGASTSPGIRCVPYVPFGLAAALVLLRLCVGWHFFQEGSKKVAYNPETGQARVWFNAEPILKAAVGPLAPTIKASLPNVHQWERLLAVPRDARTIVAAKAAAWEREYAARRKAAADKQEPAPVEFNPESASGAWAAQVAADWRAAAARFKAIEGVTEEQAKAADSAVEHRLQQLRDYLSGEESAIVEWQHELWRLQDWETAPGAKDVPFEQARIVEKRGETAAGSAGWVAQVRELEEGLRTDVRGLLTDEQVQNASLVAQADAAVADPQEQDLRRVNVAVTWLVTGIGVCLLLGLFTRLASLAGILFLLSIIATQPPWVDGAITTVFYYQLVEIGAFVVLLVSGAGQWAGLDYFLRAMTCGCRRKETITT